MRKLASVIMLFGIVSCEQRTAVTLQGENPPLFVLSGSGRLSEVVILAPEQETVAQSDPFDVRHALWQIEPELQGEEGAAPINDIRAITYGVVPRGYRQIKPESGPPPALTPGKRYRYWFVTVNAPHASGYFEIREGKAVAVDGP